MTDRKDSEVTQILFPAVTAEVPVRVVEKDSGEKELSKGRSWVDSTSV